MRNLTTTICFMLLSSLGIADVALVYEDRSAGVSMRIDISQGRARILLNGDPSPIFFNDHPQLFITDMSSNEYTVIERSDLLALREQRARATEAHEYVPTRRSKKVGGRKCKIARWEIGRERAGEFCVAKAADLGISEADALTLWRLQDALAAADPHGADWSEFDVDEVVLEFTSKGLYTLRLSSLSTEAIPHGVIWPRMPSDLRRVPFER